MNDEEREFQRVVNEGLVPKLKESATCVTILPPEGYELDAKFCVELGAMIMLDKPIIAVVTPGESVPPKLALVADHVVYADLKTDDGQEIFKEFLAGLGLI
jgi:hypothetical protein